MHITTIMTPRPEVRVSPVPTAVAYGEFQSAFDVFNDRLFGGCLPQCLITLQRHPRSLGYFSPDRFGLRAGEGKVPEIAINPQYLRSESVISTLATLAHEMTHLQQHVFGKPSRGGYHNREWAGLMKVIGLQPSSTGAPGGAETGQNMSDYPIPGGRFERVANELIAAGFAPSFFDRNEPVERETVLIVESEPGGERLAELVTPTVSGKRMKYSCSGPRCRVSVWGKPSVKIICGECGAPFAPAV